VPTRPGHEPAGINDRARQGEEVENMADVTIDTEDAGALMEGTTRDMAETIKATRQGWRWSRNLGSWYLARTLRPETVTAKVQATIRHLEAEGITVEWIDGERADDEERARRRYERDKELVDAHQEKAEKLKAEGDAYNQRSKELADMIPMGQPILVGHHSERRHRKHLDKIHNDMGKAVGAWKAAERREEKAKAAATRVAKADRQAELAANGPKFGPADIRPGDLVRPRRWPQPRRVVRVNPTTVSVETGYSWTDRIPYADITQVVKVEYGDQPRTQPKPKTIARNRRKLIDQVRKSHTVCVLHKPHYQWEPCETDPAEAWAEWERWGNDHTQLKAMPDGTYQIHTRTAGGMTFVLSEPGNNDDGQDQAEN
jgi:hypothetical protein